MIAHTSRVYITKRKKQIHKFQLWYIDTRHHVIVEREGEREEKEEMVKKTVRERARCV